VNLRYVASELRYHRHRTLVNVLGIGVGIGLFVAINAVSAAYEEAVRLPFRNLGADVVVQRPETRAADSAQAPAAMRGIRLPFSNQVLGAGDLERLGKTDGVASMATSLLLWDFDASGFRTILGVDLNHPDLGPVRVKEWLKEGRFAEWSDEVVLEKHYAKFRRATLGDAFRIAGRPFRVVGLLEIREGSQISSANLYLPLRDAQALLAEPGAVNVAYLRLASPSLLGRVKAGIAHQVKGVTVVSSDSFLEVMGGVSRISDQFSFLVSMIALGGAVFLVVKSMVSNLVERSREIGIWKAVGWTSADVRGQLMGEAFLQAALGGLFGIAAGYGASFLLGLLSIPVSTPWEVNLLPAFARSADAASQSVRLPVSLSAGLGAASLALAIAAGGLASLAMARRTGRMKPAEVLGQT
jgi:putative ABC transport system permease protein